jgi:hypothetical protein
VAFQHTDSERCISPKALEDVLILSFIEAVRVPAWPARSPIPLFFVLMSFRRTSSHGHWFAQALNAVGSPPTNTFRNSEHHTRSDEALFYSQDGAASNRTIPLLLSIGGSRDFLITGNPDSPASGKPYSHPNWFGVRVRPSSTRQRPIMTGWLPVAEVEDGLPPFGSVFSLRQPVFRLAALWSLCDKHQRHDTVSTPGFSTFYGRLAPIR